MLHVCRALTLLVREVIRLVKDRSAALVHLSTETGSKLEEL